MRIFELPGDEQALDSLVKRGRADLESIRQLVGTLIDDVRQRGDQAIYDQTERYDGIALPAEKLRVTEEEFEEALGRLPPEHLSALHRRQEHAVLLHEAQVLWRSR